MVRLFPSLVLAGLAVSAPAVVHTFDAGAQGWQTCNFTFLTGQADDFAPAAWDATGGNPGGALRSEDVSDWNFFAAPSAFLGDQGGTLGSSLSFDTYSSLIDGTYPAAVLNSGTTTLYAFSLAAPGALWTSVSIPLVGASWSLSSDLGGAPVTDAQLGSVLSSLTGLYIEADWFVGDEITGLDNVRLDPVPEPAALAALALGLAALRRRRR